MPFPFKPVQPGEPLKKPSAAKENALLELLRRQQAQKIAPPGVRTPRGGAGTEMRYGVVVTTWTSGNTVTVTRCVSPSDSTPVNSADPNIDVYLYWPLAHAPIAVKLTAGDVIGYVPFVFNAVAVGMLWGNVPLVTYDCNAP